jgi:hypothetical protein
LEKSSRLDQIAGLVAPYNACGGSIYAHQPLPLIRKKFGEPYREYAKKIIEDLVKSGYATPHKGRNVSFAITKTGVAKLRELGLAP